MDFFCENRRKMYFSNKLTILQINFPNNTHLIVSRTILQKIYATTYPPRHRCHVLYTVPPPVPLHVRTEEDVERFKTQVKTILFEGTEQFKKVAFKYDWNKLLTAHCSVVCKHSVCCAILNFYYYYYHSRDMGLESPLKFQGKSPLVNEFSSPP